MHYLQTKDNRGIDFFVTRDETPLIMVEVKWKGRTISRDFQHFRQYFADAQEVQITGVPGRGKSFPDGTELRNGCDWLANLSLSGVS